MPVILDDDQIEQLVREAKTLPENYATRMRLRSKRGHEEAELEVTGASGSTFRLILRKNMKNPLDFTAILGYVVPQTNVLFRLRRYNSKHEHSNSLEGERFHACHSRRATRRYQEEGRREDTYAEPTERYATMEEALRCLLADCSFDVPADPQLRLPL